MARSKEETGNGGRGESTKCVYCTTRAPHQAQEKAHLPAVQVCGVTRFRRLLQTCVWAAAWLLLKSPFAIAFLLSPPSSLPRASFGSLPAFGSPPPSSRLFQRRHEFLNPMRRGAPFQWPRARVRSCVCVHTLWSSNHISPPDEPEPGARTDYFFTNASSPPPSLSVCVFCPSQALAAAFGWRR